MTKQKTKKKKAQKTEQKNFLETLQTKYKVIIAIIIILIPLLYLWGPYIVNNLEAAGHDQVSNIATSHQWKEWQKENDEKVLWNPYVFNGYPKYFSLTVDIIHFDTAVKLILQHLAYWVFWFMFFGGLGMFFLLWYKKIPWYFAVIAAVAFTLLPDWQALVSDGHNTKLRAIMSLPWVILTFQYLFDKRSWLSAGLFAITFSLLIRTGHFQIVFYCVLILLFLYIYPVVKLILEKQYKQFGNFALKYVAAMILAIMTAAQPFFTTEEYQQYTTRGGNPVVLGEEEKSAKEAEGVSFEYATKWSFSPDELLDWFIPHFTGGLSQEVYEGQNIPGYWGEKPFNGNYPTVGMITFLFALIGLVYYRKDKFVVALAVFVVFTVLLSFGRHFPEFYKIFYYNLPYFAKFRAPSMILNITFVAIVIMASFGLNALFNHLKSKDFKWSLGVFGGGLVVVILVLLFKNTLEFATAKEISRYNPQIVDAFKNIREQLLTQDVMRLLVLLLITIGTIVAFYAKVIRKEAAVVVVFLMIFIELFAISNHANSMIPNNNEDKLEANTFRSSPITNYLQKQPDTQRLLVTGQGFQDNHYAYFHPIINGYSAIKLQVVQDIIENNLFAGEGRIAGINRNVLNMLNGRYIIAQQQIGNPMLKQVAVDNSREEYLYENPTALPKAWFVEKIKTFDSPENLVRYMNKREFEPSKQALLLENGIDDGKTYSGEGQIEVDKFTPNKINLNVQTNAEQFLVLSEVYFPLGWKATADGEKLDVHKVNHILRGVEVPAGTEKVVFEFHPESYFTTATLVKIGNLLTLAVILIGLYPPVKNKFFSKKTASE